MMTWPCFESGGVIFLAWEGVPMRIAHDIRRIIAIFAVVCAYAFVAAGAIGMISIGASYAVSRVSVSRP